MKIFSLLILFSVSAFAELTIKDGMVQPINFQNYPLEQFIEDYAAGFKKTLLMSSLGKDDAKINFNLKKSISLDSFERMFITVLGAHSLTLVEDKSFARVIASRDTRYTPSEFYTSKNFPKENRYILVFHELKNPLAKSITRNMRPFLSRYGRIINFNDAHSIVISDRGEQIGNLIEIINSLDNKKAVQELAKLGIKKKSKNKYTRFENSELEEEQIKIEQEILKRKLNLLETAKGER
jgi:type II secretory pathway component GspD/PulD (secretin)